MITIIHYTMPHMVIKLQIAQIIVQTATIQRIANNASQIII